MRKRFHLWPWLLGIILLSASCVYAQGSERITSFDSAITVNANAAMMVKETIAVVVTGDAIKHGIYRDFPTVYHGKWGQVTRVGFSVVSVQRDGHSEPYHLAEQPNGVRVYIGDSAHFVQPGSHTYVLTYTTDHQLGCFANHDELYWNVTGNGWSFPIDKASATVTLPATIPRKAITTSGYTGPSGSKAQNVKSWVDRAGLVHFITTKPLTVHEGLTIVTTFPKGYIHPPRSNSQ